MNWAAHAEIMAPYMKKFMEDRNLAAIEHYLAVARSMGVQDPEQYFPNPAGVDNQGDAQVVE